MDVVFELVDEGVSSNTPATVLYDSAAVGLPLVSSPATCAFVVANSTQLFGSVGSVSVTRPGSLWVVSTLPGGAVQTRLSGVAGQGRRLAGRVWNGCGISGEGDVLCGACAGCGRARDGELS